jgi:predicted transcriptional regulator
MEPGLDDIVRAALGARKGAEQADVSYSWLSKFYNGHIDNPGYATLRRLHEHLSAKPATA